MSKRSLNEGEARIVEEEGNQRIHPPAHRHRPYRIGVLALSGSHRTCDGRRRLRIHTDVSEKRL